MKTAQRFNVAAPNYNLACPHGHRAWSPNPAGWDGALCKATAIRTRVGEPDARTQCDQPTRAVAPGWPAATVYDHAP